MKNNNQRKWEILGMTGQKVKVDDIVGILLENRGIKTPKDKKEFFEPTQPEKIGLKALGISKIEIDKAIKRIKRARETKEKVIVYGDYDADGISGTAILWEILYSLGLNVLPYIPERFSEGYGLNADSIKNLKFQDPNLKLIITVDHGIVAHKKIDVAKDLGIDVIVTDHHELAITKPKSFATIHTTKISGAAVAWILSREIVKEFQIPNSKFQISDSLELVAIGTIADQIPLLGPNRSFVKYGLEALNKTKRPGMVALLEGSDLIKGPTRRRVGPYEVGFIIAPRINAMGRLEHAILSLRLLCTKDKKKAQELAAHLNRTNLNRQRIVEEVTLHARRQVKKDMKIIILAHESYHEGVIGLAAAALVEEFYRPAIVLAKKADVAKASARSISGFNIIEAIRKTEEFLIEAGGHPMAAGFSIETRKIGEFTKRLNEISKPLLTSEILTKKLKIDLELTFGQLSQKLFEEIQLFEPTGLGNPTPVFTTKAVEIIDARAIGKDGKHLKLKARSDNFIFDGISFGLGGYYSAISSNKKFDIVYSLEENTWNNHKNLELRIRDIKSDS